MRQDIIDGITSAMSEATGWNAEVRDNQGVAGVVRTSDTRVTIRGLSPSRGRPKCSRPPVPGT